MISGKQAGKLIAAQTRNEAHQQSRIVRATVTDVSERVTDGRIKCSIASTGEVVYVDAGVTLFDLAANDIVFIRKADASWRNLWYLLGFAETSGGSYVPTLRADAIDLDHLDASDGAPAPAWSTDIFGNLIAQSTCVIALEGHALGVTLDADKDTGIEAQTDDQIDFIIATATTHTFAASSKTGLGTTAIPHGAIGAAMLALEGANASTAGPHIQITTASDDYPLYQMLNWQHDNINYVFDGYYDGTWRSSDAGSNFVFAKTADTFRVSYDSGINAGDPITWNIGYLLDANGNFGIGVAPSTRLDIDAGAIEFLEMTAPAAGAANTARLFCRDNGSGKSQLCVIFATGAIQVLATEP